MFMFTLRSNIHYITSCSQSKSTITGKKIKIFNNFTERRKESTILTYGGVCVCVCETLGFYDMQQPWKNFFAHSKSEGHLPINYCKLSLNPWVVQPLNVSYLYMTLKLCCYWKHFLNISNFSITLVKHNFSFANIPTFFVIVNCVIIVIVFFFRLLILCLWLNTLLLYI